MEANSFAVFALKSIAFISLESWLLWLAQFYEVMYSVCLWVSCVLCLLPSTHSLTTTAHRHIWWDEINYIKSHSLIPSLAPANACVCVCFNLIKSLHSLPFWVYVILKPNVDDDFCASIRFLCTCRINIFVRTREGAWNHLLISNIVHIILLNKASNFKNIKII